MKAPTKYSPLGDFLRSTSAQELWLSLGEIEDLIGKLPSEAQTAQFWANAAGYHDTRRSQWLSANYSAYFRQREGRLGVLFRRSEDKSAPTGTGQPWTESELRGCVATYKSLLEEELAGGRPNKSLARRAALASFLSQRSAGSYEFRMQNISALLEELGLPRIKGYLPRWNVGTTRVNLVRLINEYFPQKEGAGFATADPLALATRSLAAKLKYEDDPDLEPEMRRVAPLRRAETRWSYVRDPSIIGWVLAQAKGMCEVCDAPAPFITIDGQPYLEVHHVRPLAEGGPDTIDNACAACPACHRRLHYGSDGTNLRQRLISKIRRLIDHPKRCDSVAELR
jgi:5-methylcytosine-specific restriction protein A